MKNMTIQLKNSIYQRLQTSPWFDRCGKIDVSDLGVDCKLVLNRAQVVQSMKSEVWSDVKTHAQGELTSYLAKVDYATYGTHWNKLAKESEGLDKTVAAKVSNSLEVHGLGKEIAELILVDIGHAVLEISFRSKFPEAPVFFEHLLQVYESGHLPCGWEGDLDDWPKGKLLVH
jgi:hypothetical protein